MNKLEIADALSLVETCAVHCANADADIIHTLRWIEGMIDRGEILNPGPLQDHVKAVREKLSRAWMRAQDAEDKLRRVVNGY